jgi:hypothetical protein
VSLHSVDKLPGWYLLEVNFISLFQFGTGDESGKINQSKNHNGKKKKRYCTVLLKGYCTVLLKNTFNLLRPILRLTKFACFQYVEGEEDQTKEKLEVLVMMLMRKLQM